VIAAFKFANDPSKDVNAFQPPPAAPTKHKKATGQRAQPTTTHRAPATSAQIAHVSFTARYGPSWIRVHVGSATGRELFAGTIDAGKSRAFAKRRLYVEIGRPGNLVVNVNGRRAALPPGENPKTVVVTSKRIRAAA
jgi:hypothetical protein